MLSEMVISMVNQKKNKALFLDRDGIINQDFGYVYSFDKFQIIPEVLDIIRHMRSLGYLIVVLTNQSGIERDYYCDFHVVSLHLEIDNFFLAHGLQKVDAWYFCPSLSGQMRKPNPGMLLLAEKDFNIDLSASLMIGDKESDILLHDEPKYFLIQGKYQLQESHSRKVSIFKNHSECLEYFKNHYQLELSHQE